MINEATLTLLNKLFHDEYLQCLNLINMLEKFVMTANISSLDKNRCEILIDTLKARAEIASTVSPTYYEVRGIIEKEIANDTI